MPPQGHPERSDENDLGPTSVQGAQLEGREVVICWNDGVWYDAIVVAYYPDDDEYKLVYRADDCLEITSLRNLRWVLAPKKRPRKGYPVLEGAIIDFVYPPDGQRYQAMVYDSEKDGEKLKIAYLNDYSTDVLVGGGWDFIKGSPCKEEQVKVEPEERAGARVKGVITKKRSRRARKSY